MRLVAFVFIEQLLSKKVRLSSLFDVVADHNWMDLDYADQKNTVFTLFYTMISIGHAHSTTAPA